MISYGRDIRSQEHASGMRSRVTFRMTTPAFGARMWVDFMRLKTRGWAMTRGEHKAVLNFTRRPFSGIERSSIGPMMSKPMDGTPGIPGSILRSDFEQAEILPIL